MLLQLKIFIKLKLEEIKQFLFTLSVCAVFLSLLSLTICLLTGLVGWIHYNIHPESLEILKSKSMIESYINCGFRDLMIFIISIFIIALVIGMMYNLKNWIKDNWKKAKTLAEWEEKNGPRTSDQWQKLCKIEVIDPDGWDRTNFTHSWFVEKISKEEFEKRLMNSTCSFNPGDLSNMWK